MPSPAELHSKFASFPDDQHVISICKRGQGKSACRYLSMVPNGDGAFYACQKAGSLRSYLDERVRNGNLRAKGDNCSGTLGFVADNQGDLVGNPLVSEEVMPYYRDEGIFDVLEIKDGNVRIGGLNLPEADTQIDITPQGITFSYRGFGAFVGTETVLFEKPQEATK